MTHADRRTFLQLCATVAAAPALRLLDSVSAAAGPKVGGKPVGLQLYSLRKELPQDVPGTLAKIRAMGFEEVEGGSTYDLGIDGFKAAVSKAGLKVTSEHHGYEQWRDDAAGVLKQAKTLGAIYVGCPWIPHGERFTREDALRAASDFNKWAKVTRDAGLRFFYHPHGYELEASPEGTLLDTLFKETDPSLVGFEMDVFWMKRGGADPVALLQKYPKRFILTHLKDLKKGLETDHATGSAPEDSSVVLGTGQIDWPAFFAAVAKSSVEGHYIEDEHSLAIDQIPETLKYLAGLRL